MIDLSCSPSMRFSASAVLHVQIPHQAGLECHPGLSCSKELWGQTCQVNLSQSDRVYPQTRPLLSKNTWGPQIDCHPSLHCRPMVIYCLGTQPI